MNDLEREGSRREKFEMISLREDLFLWAPRVPGMLPHASPVAANGRGTHRETSRLLA